MVGTSFVETTIKLDAVNLRSDYGLYFFSINHGSDGAADETLSIMGVDKDLDGQIDDFSVQEKGLDKFDQASESFKAEFGSRLQTQVGWFHDGLENEIAILANEVTHAGHISVPCQIVGPRPSDDLKEGYCDVLPKGHEQGFVILQSQGMFDGYRVSQDSNQDGQTDELEFFTTEGIRVLVNFYYDPNFDGPLPPFISGLLTFYDNMKQFSEE